MLPVFLFHRYNFGWDCYYSEYAHLDYVTTEADLVSLRDEVWRTISFGLEQAARCNGGEQFYMFDWQCPQETTCIDDLPLFWQFMGLPAGTSLSELTQQRERIDIWQGYAKLMKWLVMNGGPSEWRRALVPYHNITEDMLMFVGGRESSYTQIDLEDAKVFGPLFMDHLKRIVTGESEGGFEQVRDKLRPYQPLLEQIYRMVHAECWPDSDFSVGRFLVAVDLYRECWE